MEVSGPAGYVPGVYAGEGWFALWLGRAVVAMDPAGTAMRYETDNDVVGVARWGGGWLVIDELTVEVRSDDLLGEISRHDHPEVIVGWSIDAMKLSIVDFNQLRIHLDTRLRSVDHAP